MDARAAARRWAETWQRGWVEGDVDAIVALYAGGALFFSSPFREHEPPRAYVERVFTEEASATCEFDEPLLVDGDRAVVTWRGQTTLVGGGAEDLAGVSLLRFDDDGLVVEQRDFWNAR